MIFPGTRRIGVEPDKLAWLEVEIDPGGLLDGELPVATAHRFHADQGEGARLECAGELPDGCRPEHPLKGPTGSTTAR